MVSVTAPSGFSELLLLMVTELEANDNLPSPDGSLLSGKVTYWEIGGHVTRTVAID